MRSPVITGVYVVIPPEPLRPYFTSPSLTLVFTICYLVLMFTVSRSHMHVFLCSSSWNTYFSIYPFIICTIIVAA